MVHISKPLLALCATILITHNTFVQSIVDRRGSGPEGRAAAADDEPVKPIPYLVQVSYSIGPLLYLCGGALLDMYTVLTSATCLKSNGLQPGDSVDLYAGRVTTDGGDQDEQNKKSDMWVVHPKYIQADSRYDLAIIKPVGPFFETEKVKPIPLPAQSAVLPVQGLLAGWGEKRGGGEGGNYSSTLMSMNTTILNDPQCKSLLEDLDFDERNFCAMQPKFTFCEGDTGGPLTDEKGTTVYGVASYYVMNCDSKYPQMYTEVSSFLSWIQPMMGDNAK